MKYSSITIGLVSASGLFVFVLDFYFFIKKQWTVFKLQVKLTIHWFGEYSCIARTFRSPYSKIGQSWVGDAGKKIIWPRVASSNLIDYLAGKSRIATVTTQQIANYHSTDSNTSVTFFLQLFCQLINGATHEVARKVSITRSMLCNSHPRYLKNIHPCEVSSKCLLS